MLRTSTLAKFLVLSLIAVGDAGASRLNPVSWSLEAGSTAVAPGSTVLLHLQARVEPGYHLYSFTTPKGGAIRTTAKLQPNSAIQSFQVYQPRPNRHVDPTLGVPVETFETSATFPLLVTLSGNTASGSVTTAASVRYQACSSEICLPPVTRMVQATYTVGPGPIASAQIPKGYELVGGGDSSHGQAVEQSHPAPMAVDFRLLFAAFGFGLLALFTPCVFPTIPLTVTFLLSGENATRRSVLGKAALFCVGIVMLFSLLGLGVTALSGPFSVIQLASSPAVNGFVSLVFLAMGLSLVGAYEFSLPSAWLTGVDSAARKNGILPALLLGLTFCLASFACVGPFLGTLLAASAQSGGWAPVLGTIAFATGLATPFFFLALFPAYLKRLPRSGPWLERIKIVFGFVVLALAFKYLGTADSVAHWGIFTREHILAIWFALSFVLSLFLLGQIRLGYDSVESQMGIGRVLAGAAVLAIGISLLPGLWGTNLGGWETFLPAGDSVIASTGVGNRSSSPVWLQNDYDGALAKAKQENKPLLIAFSGYACTNCHWMKANVFSKPEVAMALDKYVLLELYTDGTDAASERNQKLEQNKFATVALPYYVIADGNGRQLAHREGLTRNFQDFVAFLQRT